MGVKNGATIGYYEQEYFPEVSRLLLIDPSMMPTEPKICHGTKAFECGMITFVLRASMGKKIRDFIGGLITSIGIGYSPTIENG